MQFALEEEEFDQMGYCDWCDGGACDLVYGKDCDADVDSETGLLTMYYRGNEVGSRKVNYCPMCGRKFIC